MKSEAVDLACEHGLIIEDEGNYFVEVEAFSTREAAELLLVKNKGICNKLVKDMKRSYL